MMRVQKAKEMKEEKVKIEDALFNKGKNWKNQLTQPREPSFAGRTKQTPPKQSVRAHCESDGFLLSRASEPVELRPEMSYDEAIDLIHAHI